MRWEAAGRGTHESNKEKQSYSSRDKVGAGGETAEEGQGNRKRKVLRA